MTEPLISIILATYNRSSFLREAIDSVYRQTYQHWECLIIDDGSTDDTPRLLAKLRDSRFRTLRLNHTDNPAAVRNAGLAVANGAYIAFLDDDDLWADEKLAIQVEGLNQSGCLWGYTAFRRIDALGQDLNNLGPRPWHPYAGQILELLLRIEAIVPLPTVMVERTTLTAAGGFDENLRDCEDYDLWFRLAVLSPAHVEETPLAFVRVHPIHRQANRQQVNASWVSVYGKAANWLVDKRLKALCLQRRSQHQVLLARLLTDGGHRVRSFELLARSVRQAGFNRAWWTTLFRTMIPQSIGLALRARDRRQFPESR